MIPTSCGAEYQKLHPSRYILCRQRFPTVHPMPALEARGFSEHSRPVCNSASAVNYIVSRGRTYKVHRGNLRRNLVEQRTVIRVRDPRDDRLLVVHSQTKDPVRAALRHLAHRHASLRTYAVRSERLQRRHVEFPIALLHSRRLIPQPSAGCEAKIFFIFGAVLFGQRCLRAVCATRRLGYTDCWPQGAQSTSRPGRRNHLTRRYQQQHLEVGRSENSLDLGCNKDAIPADLQWEDIHCFRALGIASKRLIGSMFTDSFVVYH